MRPRKSAQQTRSRATVAAILEAAAHILERQGEGALTTNRVAEVAGVSIGSLYQYFPGKTAILAALVHEFRAGMLRDLQQAAAAFEAAALEDMLSGMITAALNHHRTRPALAEALEAAERTLPLSAETQRLKAAIAALVAGLLAAQGVSRPDEAARDISAIVKAMAGAAPLHDPVELAALHDRTLRAIKGYLGL